MEVVQSQKVPTPEANAQDTRQEKKIIDIPKLIEEIEKEPVFKKSKQGISEQLFFDPEMFDSCVLKPESSS